MLSSHNPVAARAWNPRDGHLTNGDASEGQQTNGYGASDGSALPTAEADVIVIGGGFSGLMAAYDLQNAGFKTVVLEASSRVGGRSRSVALKNGPGVVEMGANWINKTTQPNVYALTQKFGLETIEQFTEGEAIYQSLDGLISRRADDVLFDAPDPALAEKLQEIFMVMAGTAEECDIRDFNSFPEEDDVSLAEWLSQRGLYDEGFVRTICDHFSGAVMGRSAQEMGAHYFFDYIKSGLGFMSVISEGEIGAQSLKIRKGTSSIAVGLASSMNPGSILVNCPVGAIDQQGPKVVITTRSGQAFSAKKVIIAIPTNKYIDISFSPPLPPMKRTVVTNTKPGIYAKMVLTYKSAWWREDGLVGKFTSLMGPICFSWDVSDPVTEQYSLALFVAGDIATKWGQGSQIERETAVVEHLATLVGAKLADSARDVLEANYVYWTEEEFIGGAPTCAQGPGMLRKYGKAWRAPFENMHFAGGEYAYEWKGYLEGAINAGKAAASEVAEALKGSAMSSG